MASGSENRGRWNRGAEALAEWTFEGAPEHE